MASVRAKAGARKSCRGLNLLLGCASIALAASVRAEVVPDLYAVEVPVAVQGQDELQRAAGVALRELAVRISGRSTAASDPGLAALFANAGRYLDQYRYERNPGGEPAWFALVHFSPAPIDGELRKAGLPVWGGNRPALHVFLVVDDNGARAVIDAGSAFAPVLREHWRRRGLVLHLPGDANAVNSDDVLRFDIAKVAAVAPERADGVLLGRVGLASSGACEANWLLHLSGQSFKADTADKDLAACIGGALDRLVDTVSAQYAIAANSGAEGVFLRVTGIANFDAYAALLNYLRRLSSVKNAQPVFLNSDEVIFQLKVEGNAEQLARQFALESRLTADESQAAAPLPVALNYRWLALPN